MADDMDEVTQRFTAETEDYVAEVQAAADDARDFAAANEEAKAAVDGLRDHAVEAGQAVAETSAEVSLSADEMRDRLIEVAEAAGLYRDEMGKLRDAQGKFFAESALMDMALGHTRDEALEAAAAVRELKKQDDSAAGGGALFGLMSMLTRAGGGIPDSAGPLPLQSLIGIVPIVEALLPELTGVVSGFAAAGAGAGAFALLAYPAIKQVTGALGDTAAQLKKQPELVQEAVREIKGLEAEYGRISKAFEPQVFSVFTDALKVAAELLPDVTPFAQTFASSVGGLLTRLGTFSGSSGFKDWLAQFHELEGPSVTAIGDGVGHLAGSVGKLLTTLSAKDDVNAINIAFSILSGTVEVLAYMAHRLATNWDEISGAFRRVRHDVAAAGHDIAQTFDTVRHGISTSGNMIEHDFDDVRHSAATMAHDAAARFDEIRHDAAQWADDVRHDVNLVISFFESLPGRVLAALAALPGELYAAGAQAIRSLVAGAGSMIGGALSTLENWGHDLANAVVHPFGMHLSEPSEAAIMIKAGINATRGLAAGMLSEVGSVRQASAAIQAAAGLSAGAFGAGALAGGGGYGAAGGGAPSVHVTMPVTLQGAAQAYNTPAFYQYLMNIVQEAVLRYQLNNPGTGLAGAGRV